VEILSSVPPACYPRSIPDTSPKDPRRFQLVRTSPLFAGFSDSDCYQIARHSRQKTFLRNEIVFRQEDEFQKLVLIESGFIKLSHLSRNGSEIILGLRGPRDPVHVPGKLTCNIHTFTAQAMVTCKTLTWNCSTVARFLVRMPQFNSNICQILADELCDLQDRYCEMSSEKVDVRLSWVLIRLAKQVGRRCVTGFEIAISRQELAQMCGTTLFTVSRLISRWGALGLVVPRREGLVVLDTNQVHFMADYESPTRL
jgi:CRP-like cAMP-binding protein